MNILIVTFDGNSLSESAVSKIANIIAKNHDDVSIAQTNIIAIPNTNPKSTILQEEAIRKVREYINTLVSVHEPPIVLAAKLQKEVCINNATAINVVTLLKETELSDSRIMDLGIPNERINAIRSVTL